METETFNPWDYNPINLTPKEIKQPLTVLANFFTDDWLPDQLERLKSWRDYILKDEYFVDEKNSPAGLLHFYKLNLCLIEAVCLIEVQQSAIPGMCVTDEAEHKREKENWRDYPTNLRDEELKKPIVVLDEFFKTYNRLNIGNSFTNG